MALRLWRCGEEVALNSKHDGDSRGIMADLERGQGTDGFQEEKAGQVDSCQTDLTGFLLKAGGMTRAG